MPISPSYKARVPKLKIGSGVISTSGTYVPPTGSSSATYPLLEQKRSSVTILSGKCIIVFTFKMTSKLGFDRLYILYTCTCNIVYSLMSQGWSNTKLTGRIIIHK